MMPIDWNVLFAPDAAVNEATSQVGVDADLKRAQTDNINAEADTKNAQLPYVAPMAAADLADKQAQLKERQYAGIKAAAIVGQEGAKQLGVLGTSLGKMDDASADAAYQKLLPSLQQSYPTLQLPSHITADQAQGWAAMIGQGANQLPEGYDKWDPVTKQNYARQHPEIFGDQAPTGQVQDPQKAMAQENDLRKEFSDKTKDFGTVSDTMNIVNGITSIYKTAPPNSPQTAAADKNLLYQDLKMIDPNLKVRPGMTASVGDVSGASDKLLELYNKTVAGQSLAPNARQGIIDDINSTYAARKTRYDQTAQQYTDISKRQGLNPNNVIINPASPGNANTPQSPNPQLFQQIQQARPDLSAQQINDAIAKAIALKGNANPQQTSASPMASQSVQPGQPSPQSAGNVPVAGQPNPLTGAAPQQSSLTTPSINTPKDAAAAIMSASQQMGVNPTTALAIASIESGLKPAAQAGTSSARGLFQFIKSTAASVANTQQGQQLGLTADGIRNDPKQNIAAGMILMNQNKQVLQDKGIDNPTPVDLYLMHFGGNPKAVTALRDNPDAPATNYFSGAQIRANKSVFYSGGNIKSIGAVAASFQARMQTGLAKSLQTLGAGQGGGSSLTGEVA